MVRVQRTVSDSDVPPNDWRYIPMKWIDDSRLEAMVPCEELKVVLSWVVFSLELGSTRTESVAMADVPESLGATQVPLRIARPDHDGSDAAYAEYAVRTTLMWKMFIRKTQASGNEEDLRTLDLIARSMRARLVALREDYGIALSADANALIDGELSALDTGVLSLVETGVLSLPVDRPP